MDAESLIIYIMCAVVAGTLAIAVMLARRNHRLRDVNRNLAIDNARLSERANFLERQLKENGEGTDRRFTAIAAEVLRANSKDLSEQSRGQIAELIAPMKENLDSFRSAVEEIYKRDTERRISLDEHLRILADSNKAVSDEARRLTQALGGNSSVQGRWGEMVLENILEKSGLRRGEDFVTQKTVGDCDTRLRPDVIINCPGGRHLIIDAKTSISDYLKMSEATDTDKRNEYAAAHLASVKKHIAELRVKKYQDVTGEDMNVDFVVMFIPHERAFITAMHLDSSLWQTAFDSRVIIASPTHLLAIIKIVEQLRRQERQEHNAAEIAETGAKMIDKLTAFMADMETINRKLGDAQKAYDAAVTKLNGRGGLTSLAQHMKDHGIRSTRL